MSATRASEQLSGIEQGLLLAALSDPRGTGHAARCLARVSGPTGERCRELHRELSGREPATRRVEIAALARRLRDLPIVELEGLHPEWLQATIDALPRGLSPLLRAGWPRAITARLRWPEADTAPHLPAALATGLPRLCARLLALRSSATGLESIEGWTSERTRRALHALGVLLLAALVRSAASLRAPLLARLPSPVRAEVEAALEAEPLPLPRHLRPPRGDEDDLPLALALQVFAPAPAGLRDRLARALPRAAGEAFLTASASASASTGELEPLLELLLRADHLARGGSR